MNNIGISSGMRERSKFYDNSFRLISSNSCCTIRFVFIALIFLFYCTSRIHADYTCFGISSTSNTVCTGHGSCVDNDVCTCNTGFAGLFCDKDISTVTPTACTCLKDSSGNCLLDSTTTAAMCNPQYSYDKPDCSSLDSLNDPYCSTLSNEIVYNLDADYEMYFNFDNLTNYGNTSFALEKSKPLQLLAVNVYNETINKKKGNSLNFGSVPGPSYLLLDNTPFIALKTNFTLSFWLKIQNPNSNSQQTIFSVNYAETQWSLCFETGILKLRVTIAGIDTEIVFSEVANETGDKRAIPSFSQFRHVFISMSTVSGLNVFVDKKLLATAQHLSKLSLSQGTKPDSLSSQRSSFGFDLNSNKNQLYGYLDELRVFFYAETTLTDIQEKATLLYLKGHGCNGKTFAEFPELCNGGDCIGDNLCACINPYSDYDCSEFPCYGIPKSDHNKVCSGKGVCVSPDSCKCDTSHSGTNCSFVKTPTPADKLLYGDIFTHKWKFHIKYLSNDSYNLGELRGVLDFQLVGGVKEYDIGGYVKLNGSTFIDISSYSSPFRHIRNDFALNLKIKSSTLARSIDTVFHEIINVNYGSFWRLYMNNKRQFFFEMMSRTSPSTEPQKITLSSDAINPTNEEDGDYNIFIKKSSTDGLIVEVNSIIAIYDYHRIEDLNKLVAPSIDSDAAAIGYNPKTNSAYFTAVLDKLIIWKFNTSSIILKEIDREWSCQGMDQINADSYCNYHGICIGSDECRCSDPYHSTVCDFPIYICNGINGNTSEVCSGKGKCVDYDKCSCNPNYEGTWCQDVVTLNITDQKPICPLTMQGGCSQTFDDSQTGSSYSFSGTIPSSDGAYVPCQYVVDFVTGSSMCAFQFVRSDFYLKYLRYVQRSVSKLTFYDFNNPMTNSNITNRIYYVDKNYNFTSIFYNANYSDSFLPGGGYALDLSGQAYAVYAGYSMFTGLVNDFSVAFWLKLRSFNERQTLVSVDDDAFWELYFENSELFLRYSSDLKLMLKHFSDSEMQYPFYLAFIKSPTTGLKVYVNLTLEYSEPELKQAFSSRKNQTESSSIGMSVIGTNYFFDGLIENFAVGFFEYMDYHRLKGYYSAIGCHNQTNPNVCNLRGICIDKSNCECNEGYYGSKCEYTKCFGIPNNYATVCSGHGLCFQLDNCTCDAGYSGSTCVLDDNHVEAIMEVYNMSFTLRTIFDSKYVIGNNELRGLDAPYNLKDYQPATSAIGGLKATLSGSTGDSPYTMFFNEFQVAMGVLFHNFDGNQTLLDLNNVAGWKLYTSGNSLVFETKEGSIEPRNIVLGLALVTPDHIYRIQVDKSSKEGLVITIDGTVFLNDATITEDLVTNQKLESYVGGYSLNGFLESLVFSYNISSLDSSGLWVCNGLRYDSPLVCSGKGVCLGGDVCECVYSEGVDCEIPFCFNISGSNTSVCSGHGECHATDECRCTSSFTGSDCRIDVSTLYRFNENGTATDSTDAQTFCRENNCTVTNASSLCNPVDGCIPTDTIDPTVQECLSSATPTAYCKNLILELHLSQNTTFNITVCEEGYYPDSNSTYRCKPMCYGAKQEDDSVCSGHGVCKYKDFCFCYEGFDGANCQIDKNYTKFINDEIALCGQDTYLMAFVADNSTISQIAVTNMSNLNSISLCALPRRTVNDFAVSFKIYLTRIDQTIKPIVSLNNLANWGIYLQGTKLFLRGTNRNLIEEEKLMLTPMLETREIWYKVLVVKSSSLGTRVYLNGGTTPDYKIESYEDYFSINASQNTNSSIGFSSTFGYIDEVMIFGIYGMAEPEITNLAAEGAAFKCFGTSMNSSLACNGNGICNGYDTCVCTSNYTGANCQTPVCFGIPSDQVSVCSGNGHCEKPNYCECNIGYFGSMCQTHLASTTCPNAEGNCTGNNVTQRVGSNFTSGTPDCNNPANPSELALCGKTGPDITPSVVYNISICKEGYYGDNCTLPICFGIKSEDPNVCNGVGNCTKPDFCKCFNSNITRRDCGVDTVFIQELRQLQKDLTEQNPNYSFRLKTSASYLSTDGNILKELGGNLTVDVTNLVLINGTISFLNGSGLIVLTKNNVSPMYLFTNDFYVAFKISVKEFRDYNPIMNISSGTSFSIYMTGTNLVIEGKTAQFTYPIVHTVPNEIELLSQPYSVVIIKSSTDGTKIYVNDHLCFSSVFSYDFINTLSNQTSNSLIGIDFKPGVNVTFAGTIDEIQIGRNKDRSADEVLQLVDDNSGMECAGIFMTDASVCNWNGKCFGYDVCVCNSNYTGVNCEIPICYGIPDSDSKVCSGHGHCEKPNECACSNGFIGSRCQVDISLTTCADPEGNCTGNNATDYLNKNNETFSSPDPDCAANPALCGKTGLDSKPSVVYNISICKEGYYGDNCSLPICFGIKSEDTNVCNGVGNCTQPDFCKCFNSNITRRDCGVDTVFIQEFRDIQTELEEKYPTYSFRLKTSLDYMYTSDNSTYMQELGGNLTIAVKNLISINNTISFQNGSQIILSTKDNVTPLYLFTNDFFISFSITPSAFPEYNPIMNISSGASFSIYMTGTTLVIQGQTAQFAQPYVIHVPQEIELVGKLYSVVIMKSSDFGTKVYINDKLCLDSPFSYDFMNTLPNQTTDSFIGFDIDANNASIGFTGSIDEIHFGKNDAKTPEQILEKIDDKSGMECAGVYLTAESVCNWNGKCFGYDVCVCNSNYTGVNCEIPICYGIPDSDSKVCSGHGHCEKPNECACSNGFIGSRCQVDISLTTCADPEGNCTGNNATDYLNKNNETFSSPDPDCAANPALCGKTGPESKPSVVYDISICKEGYYGDNCSLPICFGIKSEDPNVCSGNGNCTKPDFCKCFNSNITRRDCGVVTSFMHELHDNKKLMEVDHPNYTFRLKTSSEYLFETVDGLFLKELGGNLSIPVRSLALFNNSISFQNGSEVSIQTANITTPLFLFTNDFFVSFDLVVYEFTDYNPIMNITSGVYFSIYMLDTTLVIEGHTVEFTSPVIIAVPGEVELTNVPYTVLITKSSTDGTKVFVNGKLRYNTVFSYDYTVTLPTQTANSLIGCDLNRGTKTSLMGYLDNIQLGRNGLLTPEDLVSIVADKKGHTCTGVYLTDASVCNWNGKCFGYDVCVCNSNYTGVNCEIPICFNVPGNDSKVCSGHGHCEKPNQCACSNGFIGSRCQVDISLTTCADPEGNCTGNNATDYLNKNNETFSSPDPDCATDPALCGKTGLDSKPSVVYNISICKEGYYGDNCTLPICFGIKSEDTNVCSGNGNCTQPDFCKCFNSNITRRDCGVDNVFIQEFRNIQTELEEKYPTYSFRLKTSLDYMYTSDNSTYMQELGGNLTIAVKNLISINNTISFQNGSQIILSTKDNVTPLYLFTNDFFISFSITPSAFPEYNPIMNISSGASFSIYMTGTTLVIQGQTREQVASSKMEIPNEIELSSQTYTVVIMKSSDFGTKVYINDKLCLDSPFSYDFMNTLPNQTTDSFIGFDIDANNASIGFTGSIDEIHFGKNDAKTPEQILEKIDDKSGMECAGVYLTAESVCNWNGKCFGYDVCVCNSNYTGVNCEIPICYGIPDSDSKVCSGHGHCEKPNECACSNGFIGSRCQVDISLTTCADPEGNCTGNNATDYLNKNNETFSSPDPDCAANPALCGKTGPESKPSVVYDISICKEGYYGDNCSLPICFGIKSEDPNVCSGNGNCTKPDFCKCFNSMFTGKNCQIDNDYISSIYNNMRSVSNSTNSTLPDSIRLLFHNTMVDGESHLTELGNHFVMPLDGTYMDSNSSFISFATTKIMLPPSIPSPFTQFINDFFISMDLTITHFNSVNPIVSVSDVAAFKVYLADTVLIIEGKTKDSVQPEVTTIPNVIELENVPYTILVTKSSIDGTTVFVNGNKVYQSVFSPDYLNTMPSMNNGSKIGYDTVDGEEVHLQGILKNIAIGKLVDDSSSKLLDTAFTCDGVHILDTSVCHTNGECLGFDQCVCNANYTGAKCNVPVCFGISAEDTNVCSGHGNCESPNTCACQVGYIGSKCSIDAQNTVCKGQENCTLDDPSSFFSNSNESFVSDGPDCSNPKTQAEVYACGSTTPLSPPSVVFNVSTCKEGYYGDGCKYPLCYGVEYESEHVCSGNGNCSQPNFCKCRSGFSGANCQIDDSYLVQLKDTQKTTLSQYPYYRIVFTPHMNFISYNTSLFNTSHVFNNSNTQNAPVIAVLQDLSNRANLLIENPKFTENGQLEFGGSPAIFDTLEDESPLALFSDDFYLSFKINVGSLNGTQPIMSLKDGANWKVYLDGSSLIMQGDSTSSLTPTILKVEDAIPYAEIPYTVAIIKSYTTKVLVNGDLKGSFDGVPSFLSSNPLLNGESFLGYDLIDDLPTYLNGTLDSIVLVRVDSIISDSPAQIASTLSTLKLFTCFGKSNINPSVCSGHGNCFGADICHCSGNYTGEECETPLCYGISAEDEQNVCSGRGACTEPNKCECKPSFIGSYCQVDTSKTTCTSTDGSCTTDDPGSYFASTNSTPTLSCAPFCQTISTLSTTTTVTSVNLRDGDRVVFALADQPNGYPKTILSDKVVIDRDNLFQMVIKNATISNKGASFNGENSFLTTYLNSPFDIKNDFSFTFVLSFDNTTTTPQPIATSNFYLEKTTQNSIKYIGYLNAEKSVTESVESDVHVIPSDNSVVAVTLVKSKKNGISIYVNGLPVVRLPTTKSLSTATETYFGFSKSNSSSTSLRGSFKFVGLVAGAFDDKQAIQDFADYTTCFGISTLSSDVCSGHGTCVYTDNCECKKGYVSYDCSLVATSQEYDFSNLTSQVGKTFIRGNLVQESDNQNTKIFNEVLECEDCSIVNGLTSSNEGLYFNGISSKIDIPHDSSLVYFHNDFTTTLWLKKTKKNGNSTQVVIYMGSPSYWQLVALEETNGFKLMILDQYTTRTVTSLLDYELYYFIAITKDSAYGLSVYVNNQFTNYYQDTEGYYTWRRTIDSVLIMSAIGYNPSTRASYFSGAITKIRFDSAVLSALAINSTISIENSIQSIESRYNKEGPMCNRVPISTPALQCSKLSGVDNSGGDCLEYDICKCSSRYYGKFCQDYTCFDVMNNQSDVCNGHGLCLHADRCDCLETWSGLTCAYPTCYNHNDTSACNKINGWGVCTDYNKCTCTEGYTGQECEIPICFGIPNSAERKPSICGSHGDCIARDSCTCNVNWVGPECTIPECKGKNATDPDVCSRHGFCSVAELCVCNSRYYGYDCEFLSSSVFKAIPFNTSIVTSNGKYLFGDGKDSEIVVLSNDNNLDGNSLSFTTNSKLSFTVRQEALIYRPVVFQPFDRLLSNNFTVLIKFKFYGSLFKPQALLNFASGADWRLIYFNNSLLVQSNIIDGMSNQISVPISLSSNTPYTLAVSKDSQKGFSLFVDGTRYASNATLVEDWNVMNISRNTMNTIGYIPSMSEYDYYKLDGAIETLELSLGETLPDIFLVICNGKRGNDTSVCSGVGVCEFDSTCTCDNVHDGVDCEYHKCFGISSSNSSACNSHGSCVSVNACNCTLEYSGSECQYPICFNVPSDKNFVCSSRGTCIDPDVCICDDGYYGENCEIPMCDGLLANNSNVCSGNGQCIAHDTCICSSNFTGYICSIPICYGLNASDHHVCSSQGVCIAPDQCLCNNNTDGVDCSIITCAGLRASNPQVCGRIGKCIAPDVCEYYHCSEVESTQPEVCSSRGKCIGNNLCECDENYFGVNCQNWTCVVNNISDCSSRGSCDYANHCVCYEGHTGDACEISNCFDILSNDSSVCSGNGKCIDRNTCSCDPTYTGENCSIPICFGLGAVTYGVCAGHGSCGSPDNCSCELGFFGPDCSLTTCFGIVSNESIACGRTGKCIAPDVCEDYYCFGVESNETQACSSRGKCIGNNSCECDENYFGVNCQNWTCVVNNISDCSSRGSCDYANHCICRDGYTGDACEISNCFNVLSNDSSVCSSHGSCLDVDKCVCQSTYVGIDCSIPICFNLNASDSNVCSGRGICSSPDICKCSEGFTGPNCEFIICNGIPNNETNVCGRIGKCIAPDVCENYTCYGVVSNDTSVCSTHGLCVENNNCECTDEYSGYNCQLWPCNVNNITNCSYHGYCDYANHCTCLEGYDGLACELSICFSVLSNDSSVCSSHGSCVDKNTCSCVPTYVGIDCSIPLCFGLNASDSNVCSGRGICSSPDICKCSEGFTGSNCEFTLCYGIPNNETNVCGRIGKCIAPDVCENYTCYGVVSNDTSVCSTHGLCVGNNICECTDEYSGYNCQLWPCNVNNITNCSSRGYCDYANHCTCSEGHVGDACEISNCFNVLSNDSSVCSSHGSCLDVDKCVCQSTYVGIDCSVPICFNLNASDSNVCSGRGICSSPDICKCSEGFTGSNCEFTLCFGIPNNETNVCNGHGNCTHPDNCECNGYTGSNCSTPVCYGLPATDSNVCAKKGTCSDFDTCNWFICYGLSVNDSSVCSGSGVCVSNNTCACSEGYTGDECQYAICYGKYGKDACNNGHCSAPNNCTCDYRFEGIECNNTSYFDCANTNNCSAHGTCIAQDVCVCSEAYRGENCSIPVCFNKTLGDSCSSHGECILPGVCSCTQGFTGKNCEYLDSSKSCSNITTTTVSISFKSIDVMVMDVTCSNLVIVSSQKLSDLELPSANILSTTQTIFDGTYYLTVINYEEFSILMYTQMDVSGSTYNWKYLSNLTLADQIDKIFIMNSKLYGITIGTNNMTVTNIEFYGSLSSRSVSKGIIKTSLYDNKQLSNHTFSRETVKDLNLVVGNITSIVFTATNRFTFKPALVDYNVQDRTMSIFEFPDKDVQPTTTSTSRAVLSAINEVGTKILVATITDQGTKLFIATITQKDSITQPEMSFEQIAYYPSEVAQFSEQTDKISIVKLNDQIYLINNVKKIFVKVDVVKKTVSDISFTERSIDYLPESQFVYKPKLLKISKDILPIYTGSSYGLTFDSIIPKGATISTKLNSKVSYSLNSPTESLLCKNFQVCVTTSDLYDETTISNKKPITFFLGLGGLDTTTSIDMVLYDNSIKKIVKLSDTKLGIYGVYFKNYQVKVKYEYLVNEILVSKVVDATFVSEDYVTVDMVLEDLSTIGFISVQVSSDNGEVYSPKSLSTYVMFTPSESTTSGTTDNSTSTTTTITVIQEEEKSISGVLTFLTSALSGNDSDTSEEEAVDLKTGVSSTVVKPVFIPVISKKTGEITIKVSVGFVSNSTKSKCSTNANQVVKSVIPTSRKFTLLEKRVSIEFAVAKPDADEATLMEMLINDQTTSGYFSSSISIKNGAKYFNSVMNLGSSFETKNLSTPCEFKEGTNMKLDMKVTHSFSQLDYSEWSSQNYKDWKATLSYTIKDSNGDAICNPNSFVLPLTYPQFIEKFSNNYTLRLESSVTCADILNKPTINIETDLYNIMAACKVQKCVAHATLIPNMDESADMTAILAGALSGFVIVLLMVLLVAGGVGGVWYYRRKKMKSSKYSVYDYAHNRDDLQDAMNDLFDKMNSSDDQISSSTATTTNVIPDFDDDEDPSVLVNSYTAWM